MVGEQAPATATSWSIEEVGGELRRRYLAGSVDLRLVVDSAGIVTHAIAAWELALGRRPGEVLGRAVVELVADDDRERLEELLQRLRGDASSRRRRLETKLLGPSGAVHWYDWSLQRVDDTVVMVGREITDLKEALANLATVEAISEVVLATVSDQVVAFDREYHFHFLDGEHQVLPVGLTDLVDALALVHPEDRDLVETEIDRAFKTGDVVRTRFRALGTDLDWRDYEARGQLLATADRHWVVATLRDVTDATLRANALQEALAAAEAAVRSKDAFLSRMSHELRTPLQAILGFSQLLAQEPLTEEQADLVGGVLASGRHLLTLVDEVLDISTLDSESAALALLPIDLGGVIAECVDMLTPLARTHDVTLESELPQEIVVLGDHQRLRQILLNLVSNAITYNRTGDQVTISVTATDGSVDIAVRDTGAGLTEAQLQKLSSPFERLDAPSKGIEGSGLGLSLSRSWAAALGGHLDLTSEVGVGTTATLTVRRAETRDGPLVGYPPFGTSPHHRTTVLCLAENLAELHLLERVLGRRPDLSLLVAVQGRLGLQLAAQHHPDLVVLDGDLPDRSIDELLLHLSQDAATASTPVLVAISEFTPARADALLEAGATMVLPRPLDVGQVVAAIELVLSS